MATIRSVLKRRQLICKITPAIFTFDGLIKPVTIIFREIKRSTDDYKRLHTDRVHGASVPLIALMLLGRTVGL